MGADGVLKVRVTAPPTNGEANQAVIRLLARTLKVPPSGIRIVRGRTSRQKTLEVEGLSVDEIRQRLSTGSTA